MSDIGQLFSLDPRNLTNQNLDEIIEYLRSARHAFNAGNMKAGVTKPKTAKDKETLSIVDKLDLKGIDL